MSALFLPKAGFAAVGVVMYLLIAFMLLVVWFLGLQADLVGGLVHVFLLGAAAATGAEYLGRSAKGESPNARIS